MDSDDPPQLKRSREGAPSDTWPRQGSPSSVGIRIVGGGKKEEESPPLRPFESSTRAIDPVGPSQDLEPLTDDVLKRLRKGKAVVVEEEQDKEEEEEDEEEEEEEWEEEEEQEQEAFAMNTGERSPRSVCGAPSSARRRRIRFSSQKTFSDDKCKDGSEKELQFVGELYHDFEDDFDDDDI